MSKAIIDFEKGDISALTDIVDKLQAIIDKEGAVGQAWKQTSADINNQSKTNVDQTNKLAQSIDNASTAASNMSKVVIGGAYSDSLKQLTTQINQFSQMGVTGSQKLTTLLDGLIAKENQLKTAIQNATNPELLGQYQTGLKQTQEQIGLVGQALDTLQAKGFVFDEFAESTKIATTASVNFTTQIRQVRNELLAMTEAGQSGTAEFEALTQKYAEMQRISKQFQIESQGLVNNNEVLNGTISLLTGAAGAYQVATGAAVLFGDANTDVQQALQKLFAVMNIVQGLQQAVAVIQKSSAASILLESFARKANTESIVENNAAQVENIATTETDIASSGADAAAKVIQTGATEAATGAALELNAALLDNPVTLVIVGILALVSAIEALSSANHSAEIIQREVNQSLEDATVGLDAQTKSIDNYTKIILANASLRGASAVELSKLQGDANIQQLANIKEQSDALGKQYNNQIDYFNAVYSYGGKIDKETLDAHAKLLDEKNKLDAEYADKSQALQEEILQHQKLINDENFKSYNAYIQTQVSSQIAGTDAERNAQIDAIKEVAAARESDANFQALTSGEKALARADDEKQIQALQLQNFQHYLNGRSAAVDAELAIEKANQATSDAEQIASINKITDLQIAAIKKQRDATLANPTLNSGEQQKAIEEANLAIVEAEKKKQADILNIQKAELSLQLAAAEKGSYDAYVYNLALLKNQEDQELVSAGKNQDLINAIKAKYLKLDQDANDAFNQVQLQNEISRDNAALDRFGLQEQDKLQLTLKRLDDQQALEISEANSNGAKIAEINAKYDAERIAANKATIQKILADNLKTLDVFNTQSRVTNQNVLSNPLSSEQEKQRANDQLYKDQVVKTDLERDALEKQKLLLSEHDYQTQLATIENEEDANKLKHSETAVQIFKDEQDKKLALLKSAISVIQNGIDSLDTSTLKTGLTEVLGLFNKIGKAIADNKAIQNDPNATQDQKDAAKQNEENAIITGSIVATQNTLNQLFSDQAAQRQQDLTDNLQALEDEKNAELNNANLTAKQKDEINARYAQKEKQLKIQAFKADLEAKKEQAIVNGFLAVTNALATVQPFIPAALIAAGIAAASTAIQVAAISSTKVPKFKHGVIDIQGPGTSTSDSIPSFLSKGESVIPAEPTAKWKDALTAMKDGYFEDYLGQKFKSFVFPHIPKDVKIPSGRSIEIDYKLLAKEVANEMKGVIPASKSLHVNVDKDGIHTIVKEGNARTEFKNKRYSMP